ncbi:MAG: hypothetical protein AAFS10_01740 [Myxococcota bacterium]
MMMVHQAKQRWILGGIVGAVGLWAGLVACSDGGVDDDATLGSESHWLVYCDVAQACGDGTCTCGVCSDACTTDADCSAIPGASVCVGAEDGCGVGVCGQACSTDADCAASGLSCQDGSCRASGQWVCDGLQQVDRDTRSIAVVHSPVAVSSRAVDCIDITPAIDGIYCAEEGAQLQAVQDPEEQVVSGVCYPGFGIGEQPPSEVFLDVEDGLLLSQFSSGVRVALGETELEGPLTVAAEGAVLRGEGVSATTLKGGLVLENNNARIRGLTIEGDLTLPDNANNIALSNCRITGNLIIQSNNAFVVDCIVLGDLDLRGDNATLARVDIGGVFDRDSSPAHCLGVASLQMGGDDDDDDDDDDEDGIFCP